MLTCRWSLAPSFNARGLNFRSPPINIYIYIVLGSHRTYTYSMQAGGDSSVSPPTSSAHERRGSYFDGKVTWLDAGDALCRGRSLPASLYVNSTADCFLLCAANMQFWFFWWDWEIFWVWMNVRHFFVDDKVYYE